MNHLRLLHPFFLLPFLASLIILVTPASLRAGTGGAPAATALASASSEQLQSDIATFKQTLDVYIAQGQKLDGDLQIVIKTLDLLDKMTKDMQKLDNAMTTANDLLTVAKDFPQTEKQATTLSNGLNSVHPQVTQASTDLTTIDTKLAPTRERLRTFDGKLQVLIARTQAFEKMMDLYSVGISNAQRCISSLPAGSQKDQLQSKLDRLCDESDRRVVQANQILRGIINAVNDADTEIQTRIRSLMEPLHQLDDDIDNLLSKLEDLVDPLRDLHSLLDKSFSVKFPYPSPTWKEPWRMKHYKLSIGFRTILKGSDAIEKEIEHLLSSEMYKLAKAFGLEKLIKDLQHQADDELNGIMRRLHLDFRPELPGLSGLHQELSDLTAEFGVLSPKLDINTQPFEDLMNEINADISEIKNIYSNCK